MKIEKEQSVQKNIIFNTVGNLIYYICQWLMSIVIVRMSGYEDAGVLSIAMSVSAAPAIIALFNVRSYQVSDLENEFTDETYIYSRLASNLLASVICVGMAFIGRYNLEKMVVIFAYMSFKLVEGYADVYYGIEQKWNRMDYIGKSMSIRGIGGILLFVLVFYMTSSLFVSVESMSFFSLAVILFYDRRIVVGRKKSDGGVRRKDVERLLRTCFPLAVVAFFNNLSINLPKIFLERYYGSEVMGYYGSVSSPTVVIQLAATTVFAPLVTLLTMAYAKKEKKRILGILKVYFFIIFLLSCVCMIGAWGLGEWVLVLLFQEGIMPYVYLLLPIIVVSFFTAINANLFSVCTLLREIRIQYLIGAMGIVSSFVLSFFVVRMASVDGVIYATLGTLMVQIVIQIIIIACNLRKI